MSATAARAMPHPGSRALKAAGTKKLGPLTCLVKENVCNFFGSVALATSEGKVVWPSAWELNSAGRLHETVVMWEDGMHFIHTTPHRAPT